MGILGKINKRKSKKGGGTYVLPTYICVREGGVCTCTWEGGRSMYVQGEERKG